MLQLNISDVNSLKEAANKLLALLPTTKVIAFEAPMGAGKTTFIKVLCEHLGVTDTMSSPTYSIVNAYSSQNNGIVFHFDLYRLTSTEELLDIGFEDYITNDNYCFIEWPQLAEPLLPLPYIKASIKVAENNRYLYAEIIN